MITIAGIDILPFDIRQGGSLMKLSFSMDLIAILLNVCVIVVLYWWRGLGLRFTYGMLLVVIASLLYKVSYLLFYYAGLSMWFQFAYLVFGYLSLLGNVLLELEVFKRFNSVAVMLMGSKVTSKHISICQWAFFGLYHLTCGWQYVLAFKLGDQATFFQPWMDLWFNYVIILFVLASLIIVLGVSFYQLYLLRVYVGAFGSKWSVVYLQIFVFLQAFFDIAGAVVYPLEIRLESAIQRSRHSWHPTSSTSWSKTCGYRLNRTKHNSKA
ncbi:hypothetical protein EDD86DRAFT_243873 [Gorgonomyces haynaldii]|nr:hypothetical protein EDD86DRAFT_243873 [Gorgonomyces haynaldii]